MAEMNETQKGAGADKKCIARNEQAKFDGRTVPK